MSIANYASAEDEKVLEYFVFGSYEQDNDLSNGPEPIEWMVLDRDGSKALLASRYILDCRLFNETSEPEDTWENCSLRAWLNGEFLEKAFTADEQAAILITELDNSADEEDVGWNVDENNTMDRVFVPRYMDVHTYFYQTGTTELRAPTDYAVAQGAKTLEETQVDGRAAGMWWVRAHHEFDNIFDEHRRTVEQVGYPFSDVSMNEEGIGVCPFLWVDLDLIPEQ